MIIVLEGVNGTGKSTYAKKISGGLNAVVIRPFRQGDGHHFTGNTPIERDLKALGVPYNTHVDEMYVADIIGRLARGGQRFSVVLDRSIGSAIAHHDRPLSDSGKLVDVWYRLMGQDAPVLYVWLTAPWHVAQARLAAEQRAFAGDAEARHNKLQGLFRHAYDLIPYNKLTIDTATTLVDEGVRKVVDQVI